VPPQPSEIVPHAPAPQVALVQHCPLTQAWVVALQVPHESVWPQPSDLLPQVWVPQLAGVQH
jgi:hypothetical protein